MKESTARIGDTHSLTHDRTVSECFPCRWPEMNNNISLFKIGFLQVIFHKNI